MKIIAFLSLCLTVILTTNKHALAKSVVNLEEPLEANIPNLHDNNGQADSELGKAHLNIITDPKLNDELDQGKNSYSGFT